ncbi:hypothetical protein [Streptosporangium subroseum]|uniref:hypothetical protein n=1 Tax=Streptosporangium subroseum TaxID=106412 RepID=UPI00308FA5D4|nr:CDP-glycerol glycerophosphotransferase family protein [Streptosporangium subroseum]
MNPPGHGRWTTVGVTVALVLSCPATMIAALWPNAWVFALTAAIGYAVEPPASRHVADLVERLSQVNAGITLRFVIREVALILLLIRLDQTGTASFVILVTGLLGLHVVRGVYSIPTLRVAKRRRLPLVTRGIDLSELAIPDAPHRFFTLHPTRTMLHLDVPVVAGTLIGLAAGTSWPGLVGLAVAYALGLAGVAHMARHALRNRHLGDDQRAFDVVNRRLAELKPEVALYFSGSRESAYQVNMWLSTLDDLDRRALIILRERAIVPLLGPTRTPVVCVPKTPDIVRLDLSGLRFALYPANVGNNLHLLRVPGIRSAFINHGDSDKPASFNPFAKAYDEVWVAGPAGRERYLSMPTGVRDEDIVEVGRPQLASIRAGAATPDPMFTVLYAPTWEGWSDDLLHSSVATMGPKIVRALLDHTPPVRLLYKPHPLTGTRDARATEAHHEIVAMIEQANAARAAGGTWAVAAERARERGRLEDLTRRLEAHAGDGAVGDEAQISRDTGRSALPGDGKEVEDAWHESYWKAVDWWRHRVITGPRPHVYDCFNRADLLITDISSVAGDFIVSGKPFAVTNVGGLGAAEFRRLFPTAATAAYLVTPDCAELPKILAEADGPEPDVMAERRRDLKNHLLGPDEPDSVTRFAAAVDALITKDPARAGEGRYVA